MIHIGDIKAGAALCTDEYFQDIADQFATFTDPLVYTPGDNEWTDCHRANNGGYNPLERLAKVRELFFPNPGYTLGVPTRIKAQKGFPENQRWAAANVEFAALHILGSNNGLAPWFGDRANPVGETAAETASRVAEYQARWPWPPRSCRQPHAETLSAPLSSPTRRTSGPYRGSLRIGSSRGCTRSRMIPEARSSMAISSHRKASSTSPRLA